MENTRQLRRSKSCTRSRTKRSSRSLSVYSFRRLFHSFLPPLPSTGLSTPLDENSITSVSTLTPSFRQQYALHKVPPIASQPCITLLLCSPSLPSNSRNCRGCSRRFCSAEPGSLVVCCLTCSPFSKLAPAKTSVLQRTHQC